MINNLSERRQKVWSKPWADWKLDDPARTANLSKLLEEAFAEKRKQRAQAWAQRGSTITGKVRSVGVS